MELKKLPSPNSLRSELKNENLPPGSHDPSVVQFGCDGCKYGHRFVAGWLPVSRLIEMSDRQTGVPRAFVSENFSSVGKADVCPVNECLHEEELKTVVQRSYPFPDIDD